MEACTITIDTADGPMVRYEAVPDSPKGAAVGFTRAVTDEERDQVCALSSEGWSSSGLRVGVAVVGRR